MPKKVTSVSSLFNRLKVGFAIFALLFCLNVKADYEDGVNAAFAGEFDTAFREFSIAAEEGLDLAQYNLAILYFTGQGMVTLGPRQVTQAQTHRLSRLQGRLPCLGRGQCPASSERA